MALQVAGRRIHVQIYSDNQPLKITKNKKFVSLILTLCPQISLDTYSFSSAGVVGNMLGSFSTSGVWPTVFTFNASVSNVSGCVSSPIKSVKVS